VLFERLLAVRNDVGLLAEEYEPRSGRHVRESLEGAVREANNRGQSRHLGLLLPSVHGHRPQPFCLPQAAQRAGAFTLSTPFAAPARTIAKAPPPAATHPAACASVTCIRRADPRPVLRP
jgi:hypothetical protein